MFSHGQQSFSQQLEMRLRHLVLVIAAKNHARASQQCGRNQRANHDWSSPAWPLHARNERGRRTKATKHQCDGGNGNISSVHKTTSSTRKTLFLMNQCAPRPYARRTATVSTLLTQARTKNGRLYVAQRLGKDARLSCPIGLWQITNRYSSRWFRLRSRSHRPCTRPWNR